MVVKNRIATPPSDRPHLGDKGEGGRREGVRVSAYLVRSCILINCILINKAETILCR